MNNSNIIMLVNENGAEKAYGEIPDLWHIAQWVADQGQAHCAESRELILQVWHMAHDLKAVIEQQGGARIVQIVTPGENHVDLYDLVEEFTIEAPEPQLTGSLEEFKAWQDQLQGWATENYDNSFGAQVIIECWDKNQWKETFYNHVNANRTMREALDLDMEVADAIQESYQGAIAGVAEDTVDGGLV